VVSRTRVNLPPDTDVSAHAEFEVHTHGGKVPQIVAGVYERNGTHWTRIELGGVKIVIFNDQPLKLTRLLAAKLDQAADAFEQERGTDAADASA